MSVTLAGKSPRKNGRRLQYATGTLYQRSFQHVSTILWNHHGQRLQPQEEAGGSTTPLPKKPRSRSACCWTPWTARNAPTRQNDWPEPSRTYTHARAAGGTPATRTVIVPAACLMR